MSAMLSVAMTEEVDAAARAHLLRRDKQEDICFALWRKSAGERRTTALVYKLVLPRAGDRNVHGNASFEAQYFERVLGEASADGAGVALLHSHPHGHKWQGMSPDDVAAEYGHAPAALAATKSPLVGLTLAGDKAWSARFWPRVAPRTYVRQDCSTVRVVGAALRVSFNDTLLPVPLATKQQIRTVSAWGNAAQGDLVRLRVGVVGVGSVGGIVAESLARTGFTYVVLIDFDHVEIHNLDRLVYATKADVGRPKIEVLAERLRSVATAEQFEVHSVQAAVFEQQGYLPALDCDILIACVDRPWGRQTLNLMAYVHLIPVVDGGIAVRTNRSGKLAAADWRAHTVSPGRRCLQCIGQYLPSDVQLEREGQLDDPTYIAGLDRDHRLKANENVFAFSLGCASLQILQMLNLALAPAGMANAGEQMYHFVGSSMELPQFGACGDNCLVPTFTALGDSAPVPVIVPNRHYVRNSTDEGTLSAGSEKKPTAAARFLAMARGLLKGK